MKALAYFLPELEVTPGGAERQIYLWSRELARREDMEVHICVEDLGQEKHLTVEGVQLWASVNRQRSRLQAVKKLYETMNMIDADVYVFRSADLGVALGAFMAKRLGKKVVYMIANSDEASPAGLKAWCGRWGAWAMSWVYRNADVLLAQTRDQIRDFKRCRNIEVQVRLPNLFMPPEHKEGEQERDLVLWVGRADPLKRPDLFIRLAEQLPHLAFVMVCPDTSYLEYSAKCRQNAAKVDNLQLLDRQNGEALQVWYKRALLLINTSVSEGFSNVMLEALYHQTPIYTLGVNPDQLLGEGERGEVFESLEQLKDKVAWVVRDTQQLRSMGARGRDYVLQEHSLSVCLELFLDGVKRACST